MDQFRRLIWRADKYTPTRAQAEWIFDGRLTKLVAGGVRSGKSKSTSRSFDWWGALEGALIWIVGPSYDQAKAEFDYFIAPYEHLGLTSKISRPEVGPRSATISGGATVQTKTSDDLKKLASFAPDVLVFVEAGQQHSGIVDKAFERGLEKDAMIVFSGTFEGSLGWYHDVFRDWETPEKPGDPKSYSLATWTNTVVFPGGEDDPKFRRLIKNMEPELLDERVNAVPHRPSGLVFREFSTQKHVKPLAFDPDQPLYIAMDPAYHSFAVLFIQVKGEYVHVLDEIYKHKAIVQDILPLYLAHPLKPYVVAGVADVASKQRHGNESVHQIWRRETGQTLITNKVSIVNGIRALKLRLMDGEDGLPRLLIDSRMNYRKTGPDRASSLRAEFDMYQWPAYNPGRNTRMVPIDSNNDAIKALSYFLFWKFRADIERQATGGYTQRSYWRDNL